MLRRSNSHRLDRRKSTSSVLNKHEPIDPEVARLHAHAAATLAFARAQERSSADMGHRGGALSRSNTNNQSNRQPLPQQTSPQPASRGIRRQQSVRFVRPTRIQRRESLTRTTDVSIQPQLISATLKPIAMTTNVPVPAEYRPPSRSSSIGKTSLSKVTVQSLVAATAFDEYYTREDDVASTPSSYRRVRRSKSMFSPLKAPSIFYTNGSPNRPESFFSGAQNTQSYSQIPSSQAPQASLRAPRSMSFLRGHRGHAQRNDEAVQQARDRFFHETQQQRLREQPSFLFRSRSQKHEKPFRKTVRSSSNSSSALAANSSNPNEQAKESALRHAARKASKTLKDKFRRVFGRSKDKPVVIPNQQVDARETHVRQYNGDSSVPPEHISNVPHPDRKTLSRVASRVPSLHAVASGEQLKSYAGSVKSLRSDKSDEKSRVTSWNTGSTAPSQVPRAPIDREHQRLSVINEVGTHISSSSFTRPRMATQFSAYPIVHRPSKSAPPYFPKIPNPPPPPISVDSARVYEALMKRLEDNSPTTLLEAARRSSEESLEAAQNTSGEALEKTKPSFQPSGSVTSSRENTTPATIRHVLPSMSSQVQGSISSINQWSQAESIQSSGAEDMVCRRVSGKSVNNFAGQTEASAADDVFSPKDRYNKKENIPINQKVAQSGPRKSLGEAPYQGNTQAYLDLPEADGLTPQQIAARNEPYIQAPKLLRDARSTFFGGSTFTISRAASPFRRAMAQVDPNLNTIPTEMKLSNSAPPLRNPLYLGPSIEASVDYARQEIFESEKAYSDSIYSRTTGGQTPGAANSAGSLPLVEADAPQMPINTTTTGDAVILDRAVYHPTKPSDGHRITSSSSSQQWKTWMSLEVAKLERAKENNNTSTYVNYALPTMPKSFRTGHVREAAQINDDDVEVAQRKSTVAKQPLGLVQQQSPNIQIPARLKPILKKPSSTSLVENTESSKTPVPIIPIPPPAPPPIPPRSPLRHIPSKSSLQSVNTVNIGGANSATNSPSKITSLNGRNVLHKRNTSQTTLHSVKSASIKSLETPVKLVKRHRRPSNTITPSRCLVIAVEKQFGSMSTTSRYMTPGNGVGRETKVEGAGREVIDDVYDTDGAGLMGPRVSATEKDAQASGSKRMVDLFLSSRRKRLVSDSDDVASVFL